ncbi:Beta-galactosidase 5, partial [Globisporangium splendens]
MEWLALDARLERKKKAKLRRQQRELKRQQKQQEERERQQRKRAQRCAEMQREELLSRAMEQLYKEGAERKLLELKREQDMKMLQQVSVVRRRAQELGLPVATPGISGLERLQELEARIVEKESALQRAAMAKQRLDALPQQKEMLEKVMGELFTSSLQKKVERVVYKLECDRLLSLFDPESHTCDNRAAVLLSHDSKNGFTPVLAAIFCKKWSILRRLLEMGAEPNFETSWGMTPLLASVMTDDAVALSILMEFHVDLNYVTRQGVRAIHLAADKDRLDVLKMLCRDGADVNATAINGRSAVAQAVISNQFGAVKILLAFQANKLAQDQNGMSASNWAAKLKFTHMVSLVDSSISSSSLLAQIMEDEEDDSAVKVASAAAHLAYQRHTKLLETAMRNRDIGRLLQLLEDPSFSPNYEDACGNTPFLVVCEVGSCKDIMLCLEKKAVPAHQNRNGVNALIAASFRGDIDILELLIAAGCSLLTRDFKGWDCYRYLNKFNQAIAPRSNRESFLSQVDSAVGHAIVEYCAISKVTKLSVAETACEME